jgi:ribosomal protein S12 methylthiotransferase
VRHVDTLEEAPEWIRIHYLYPGRITQGFLETVAASARVVPYVDLPLQHAHRETLARMRRPGHAESYLRQLEALRRAMPDAGMRSGFIVGFPGETEEAFEELCAFVERARFDAVGVFTYSHEESTAALEYEDDVPPELKEERRVALEEIAAAASHERGLARIGQRVEVLVEGDAEDVAGAAVGRWAGQAPDVDGRVLVVGAAGLPPGRRVAATVVDAGPHELVARSDVPGTGP